MGGSMGGLVGGCRLPGTGTGSLPAGLTASLYHVFSSQACPVPPVLPAHVPPLYRLCAAVPVRPGAAGVQPHRGLPRHRRPVAVLPGEAAVHAVQRCMRYSSLPVAHPAAALAPLALLTSTPPPPLVRVPAARRLRRGAAWGVLSSSTIRLQTLPSTGRGACTTPSAPRHRVGGPGCLPACCLLRLHPPRRCQAAAGLLTHMLPSLQMLPSLCRRWLHPPAAPLASASLFDIVPALLNPPVQPCLAFPLHRSSFPPSFPPFLPAPQASATSTTSCWPSWSCSSTTSGGCRAALCRAALRCATLCCAALRRAVLRCVCCPAVECLDFLPAPSTCRVLHPHRCTAASLSTWGRPAFHLSTCLPAGCCTWTSMCTTVTAWRRLSSPQTGS